MSARIELAYARSTPWVVYASRSAKDNEPSELFYSDDGGYDFMSLGHPHPDAPTGTGPFPGASYYANTLWVDPTDPDTVVVGGVYLFRTVDRGVNWEGAYRGAHLDHHIIVEDPGYTGVTGGNKIVYCGTDGGVYRTNDILANVTPTPPPGGSVMWTSLNNTLGVTQFYGGAGNAVTGTIFGGTQDNGTLHYDGDAENWMTLPYFGGDGGFCAADQVVASESPYYYGEAPKLVLFRVTDLSTNSGGFIWNGPNGIPPCENSTVPCALSVAPFILDPNDRNRILAGGRNLWRTNHAREAEVDWAEIKSPISGGSVISAIAVAEGNSNLVWVGYTDGSVSYKTTGTAGPTPTIMPSWNPGDPNNMLPRRNACTRITIGHAPLTEPPDAPRTVYVTFGGFYPTLMNSRGNVWKRENNGTWTDIHHNLPSTPIFSLVISPSNPDFLYVGTEVGVFASANGGATWSPAFGGSSADTLVYSLIVSASSPSSPDIVYVGTDVGVFGSKDNGVTWSPGFGGPANTRVAELFWMGPKLVVATHGRGMFTLQPAGP